MTLQAADVKAISVAECQQYWSNTGETHICVWEEGSKGACNVSFTASFISMAHIFIGRYFLALYLSWIYIFQWLQLCSLYLLQRVAIMHSDKAILKN